MSSNQGNYRSIFKATAILGSVQLFNIIIGIIRNKIVSILLGPAGMGIVGMLISATQTVNGFTNCGLTTSAVKNLSVAYEEKDIIAFGKALYVLRRLLWSTGILGALVALVLSKQLSIWSFGNEDFTPSFTILSLSLIITQLTNGNIVILKACRQIKLYAKANVLGNFLSLFITLPLYYIWGAAAIVPVLLSMNVTTFVCAYIYQRKLNIAEVKTEQQEFKEISWDIFKVGIAIAVSEVFPLMASYLIRANISNVGGLTDVGLYSAGFAILNGYVGMIFTAMSSDYIPRLSGLVKDDKACEVTINSQLQLSFLILFPILALFIVFSKVIVYILYSADFFAMTGMLYWGALAMLFKTLNWCYGCILIPKRDSKVYFIFSVLSAAVYLGASVVLYNYLGVTGLGVAFLISHFFDFIPGYIYVSRKYGIKVFGNVLFQFCISVAVLAMVIAANALLEAGMLLYCIDFVACLFALLYSIYNLNKLMDLKSFILSKIRK